MPELPEVETVRRGLIPELEGRQIVKAIQFIFLNILRDHTVLVTRNVDVKDRLVKTAFIQRLKKLVALKLNGNRLFFVAVDHAWHHASATCGPGGPLANSRASLDGHFYNVTHRISLQNPILQGCEREEAGL